MTAMNRLISRYAAAVVAAMLLSGAPAFAQLIVPPAGGVGLIPPPPAAPPPPRIDVPVVPRLNDLPTARGVPVVPRLDEVPTAQNSRRRHRSFGDRVTDCLADGAAAGLGPNQRAEYSRACANR